MKRVIFAAILILATAIPVSAFASFVCSAEYFPDAGAGVPSRIRLTISTGASCSGAQTSFWFCEKSGTATLCAIPVFRYALAELINLDTLLVAAAHSQQEVSVSTTNCNGGATGCGASVMFH